jgi:nuclease S1
MRTALLIPFWLCSVGPLFGWGCEGHQIVALIARAHLTPAAASAVDQLLQRNPIDPSLHRFCQNRPADLMADASTWADDVKNTEKTGAWHFVDIPLTVGTRTSLAPFCHTIGISAGGKDRPGCITNAIQYEQSILRDQTRSGAERAGALRYVIHFAGDIHQPLHDCDNNDRGGNCTAVRFFAEQIPANLHAVWDYKLIARELSKQHATEIEYARRLDQKFAGQAGWARIASPVDWAWEGHRLARTAAYGYLNPPIPFETPDARADCEVERDKVTALHIAVGSQYSGKALPIIDEQLAKAGYRLAVLLNSVW